MRRLLVSCSDTLGRSDDTLWLPSQGKPEACHEPLKEMPAGYSRHEKVKQQVDQELPRRERAPVKPIRASRVPDRHHCSSWQPPLDDPWGCHDATEAE
jgi:hypothetical protein